MQQKKSLICELGFPPPVKMRSLRLTDGGGGGGGKGDSQVHDVSAMEEEETSPPPPLQAEHRKGRSAVAEPAPSSRFIFSFHTHVDACYSMLH
jgi:hypothetical protein